MLVGEATRRAAESAIVFEPIGDHSLKGKTSPVPAWQAIRVVAARGGQGRADALEAPFVGRDEELRELKEVLHAVGRDRRVRLVSITGPGGIGKSRLVWELEKYIDGVDGGHLLAPRPVAVVRGGRHVLGPRRDGAAARRS